MQIWAGGEKLSDTKVGEFDRGPLLLLLLSAMQPTPPASIITDSVIRSTATCCRWNRPPFTTGEEKETYFILAGACAFPPCCCQEMNKWLSLFAGKISHLLASFSQLMPFSPYKAGNEISPCAVSPLAHRLLFCSAFFLSEYPFSGSKKKKKLYSLSQNRGVVSSNNMPSTSEQIHTLQ